MATCRPGSSVGIATGYGLDGPRIETRLGARFSAPVQTGPVAHPAPSTMGTGSFPWVDSGRGLTLTRHPFLLPWSRKSRAIHLLPLLAVRLVPVEGCTLPYFTFYSGYIRRGCFCKQKTDHWKVKIKYWHVYKDDLNYEFISEESQEKISKKEIWRNVIIIPQVCGLKN